MLLSILNVWSRNLSFYIMVRGWRSRSSITIMVAVQSWVVRSFGFLVGSYIFGIIMWTIGIVASNDILREDPRLASASTSILSSLITWIRLKFSNYEAIFLSI